MNLGLILGLGARSVGGGFSPASLPGLTAWFVPSDLATMYQENTGLTPVTTAGQQTGFLGDKSQGFVLGAERVTNVAAQFEPFSANSTLISEDATSIVVENSTGAQFGVTAPSLTATVGVANVFVMTLTSSATRSCNVAYGATSASVVLIANVPNTVRFILVPGFTVAPTIRIATSSIGDRLTLSNPSLKPLPGNHATQATAASRPTYQVTGSVAHLTDDGGDSLNWAAPAGTYTVAFVDSAGVVIIETSQALSGATDMLRATQTAGYVAVNRALDAGETADLTAYLEGLA